MKKKEKKTTEEIILVYYHDFIKDMFSKESFDKLLPRKLWDHMIELVPGDQPIDCKVTHQAQKSKDNWMIFKRKPRIWKGKTIKVTNCITFLLHQEKDGKLRPFQDYWKLNKMKIQNHYLLPLIQELVDKLKGAKYFMKLDI